MADNPSKKSWMEGLNPSQSANARAAQPVSGAAQRAAPAPPFGLGLTSDRLRIRMVERLAAEGIGNQPVLAALREIPRHLFVDEGLASRAYENSSLPIGHAQTISQPYIVARMSEVLCDGRRLRRVLEIGTGCGYQAAILSRIADQVFSIERIRALHERAHTNLRALQLDNLRLIYGDGMLGLPDEAPFDGMLVAAAAETLPSTLLTQLRIGGRLVAPFGTTDQTLCLIVRTAENQWSRTPLEAVRFVPLKPGLL